MLLEEAGRKKEIEGLFLTTRPKERICSPLKCLKSVNVQPSTGESSSDPKSVTKKTRDLVYNP